MINYPPCDIQNYRTGIGNRGEVLEVNCWMLDVPLSLWSSWFITMNFIEFIHIYPKTGWEEVSTTNDTLLSLVSKYFAEFINNILYNMERFNNCMERLCIMSGGILFTKSMRDLILRSQVIWVSTHL